MKHTRLNLALAALALAFSTAAMSEDIGSVDTAFKLVGSNHKVVVEVFDDPKVQGVSCYVSRAKTGGITGSLGLAEDKANASIACRQVGEISFKEPVARQEEVFTQKTSILFKTLRVVRMVDPKRNVLTYLTYSDRLIDGSPQNSITAVPVEAVTVRYNLKDTDPEGFHGGTPSYRVGDVTVTVDVQKANQIKDGGPYVSTPSREYL